MLRTPDPPIEADGTLPVLDDYVLSTLVDNLLDPVTLTVGTTRVFVNKAFMALLGRTSKAEVEGTDVGKFLLPADAAVIRRRALARQSGLPLSDLSESRIVRKDGEIRVVQTRGIQVLYRGRPASLAFLRDVTERRNLEAQLRHQAMHDPLTDLLNRRGFERELRTHLDECVRRGTHGALIIIDLDQFKDVNDSLGHLAGDEILVAFVSHLQQLLGERAVIGRLGGDEFAILVSGVEPETATEMAESVVQALRARVFETAAGEVVSLTASAGIVLFPNHGVSAEQLMKRADIALYGAKERGRNRADSFSEMEEDEAKAKERITLRRQIRDALDNESLLLHGQPILDLRRQVISGIEFLVRMVQEDGTILPAARLITLSERSGLAGSIDCWVVRRAIGWIAEQTRRGYTGSFEINLSARSFNDNILFDTILTELARHEVPPSQLVFEVTESAAISDFENSHKFIRSLKGIGCRFALDDFGVGSSSLHNLKHLAVDFLKIDGSFIRGLSHSAVDQAMVGAIVKLARALSMETVAESVENARDLAVLQRLGVDFAQGYHIGRPRDLDELNLSETYFHSPAA